MSWSYSPLVAIAVALVLIAGAALAWQFAFFLLPFNWTGEPEKLARALALRRGTVVADIGAGSGELAVAMSALVGQVYATELSADRRAAIARRVARTPAHNVEVREGEETGTGLPNQCCDAIYMRAVLHHVADREAFAASLARSLRSDGRVGIIDFAPGTLWFHGSDHGVRAESVVQAFRGAGLRLRQRDDRWGGGMFLLVFDREPQPEHPQRQ